MTDRFRASFDAKTPDGVEAHLSLNSYQHDRQCQATLTIRFEHRSHKTSYRLWGRKNREIGRQVELIEMGVIGDESVLDVADQLEAIAATLRTELAWLREQHDSTHGEASVRYTDTASHLTGLGRAIWK